MPVAERPLRTAVDSPYPGLRTFEPHEAHLFRGRQAHTRELLDRLAEHRFLAVVGTSGSGKSSLVRAGLVPALDRGFLAGATSRWRVAIVRPGRSPIKNLAEALAHEEAMHTPAEGLRPVLERSSYGILEAVKQANLAQDESLLLVVDQFEEIFRFQRDPEPGQSASDNGAEAHLFVASLLEAAAAFSPSVYVVLTMRSDFLGDCTQFPGLPEALNRSQYLIPRLTRDQLREAIEKPLAIFDAKMAPALVQRLLYELGDDSDQLPVLQHALNRTFHEWKRAGAEDEILVRDYEEAGGLQGALNLHADSLLADLPRTAVERVFRCLTTYTSGRAVRRPADFKTILAVTGAISKLDARVFEFVRDEVNETHVRRVIERFSGPEHSLVVLSPGGKLSDSTMVDISHESLIRRWKELEQWVKDEAESVRWYADAAEDARRRREGKAQTWRDPKLAHALRYLATGQWSEAWVKFSVKDAPDSFFDVRSFLDQGTADQAREIQEKEKLIRAEADAAQAAAKAEADAKEKALALAESERVAKEHARMREEAERVAKENALAKAEAEEREKEQAVARAAAERGQRRWFQRGLVLALLFLAAAGAGAWYYYRSDSMQRNLSIALEEQTKAQDHIKALTGPIEYYDGKIREAQAVLDRKPLDRPPSPAERERLEGEIAKLREQRGTAEAQRREAERERIAAQKKVHEIAQYEAKSGSVTLPSVEPGKTTKMRDGLTYVAIPAGTFQMGCSPGDSKCQDDEKRVHSVTITNSFWIGQTEVTQAAWKQVMKTDPARFKGDDLPVESVSWDDANRYCQAIGARLPTEAEWEYAARAGSTKARYGELDEVAWFADNSGKKPLDSTRILKEDRENYSKRLTENGNATKPVKGKAPNQFGLYDMLGNVWEWTADWYGEYPAQAVTDPRGPTSGSSRVLRGGSWSFNPAFARASIRDDGGPSYRVSIIGFRCAGELR